MNVFVTGGSGYLGQRLVARLLEEGHAVRVLARRPRDWPAGVEAILGDLAQPHSVAHVAQGADVLFHLGGGMRPQGGDLRAVNVQGSLALLRGAIRDGVPRFVFVSAAVVYGDVPWGPVRESDPPMPLPGHAYAEAKREAEEALLAEAADKIRLVLLRPPQIYSRDAASLPRFVAIAREIPGENKTHFVHREDVVQALELAMRHPDAQGVYNVADAAPLPVREAAQLIEHMGYGPKDGDSPPPPALLRFMQANLELDTTRLRTLGFRPQYPSLAYGLTQP